jgi:magnesium-transporting ATPase (P-type)
MKKCSYCGAEYPDDAVVCVVDQTPFTAESPATFADAASRTPHSPLALALTSGLAAFLICTGIFFAVGRVMLDIWRMHHPVGASIPANYHDIGLFIHPAITWTIFSLGTLLFTFFICYNRCQTELHGIITTMVTLCIIALLTLVPMLVPSLSFFEAVVPVVLIGMSVNISAGYYIVATLQIVVGAWLLNWFRWEKAPSEKQAE